MNIEITATPKHDGIPKPEHAKTMVARDTDTSEQLGVCYGRVMWAAIESIRRSGESFLAVGWNMVVVTNPTERDADYRVTDATDNDWWQS